MRARRFCVILFIFLLVGSLFSSCGQWVTDRLQQQTEESLRQGDYTQAAELFSRLIEAEPDNPRAYTGLAEAYTGLGEMDHAAQAIQQGITQLPGNEEIAGFFYTPMLLVGGWSYYPEGYGGDGTNYYGYSEDEWGSRHDSLLLSVPLRRYGNL